MDERLPHGLKEISETVEQIGQPIMIVEYQQYPLEEWNREVKLSRARVSQGKPEAESSLVL